MAATLNDDGHTIFDNWTRAMADTRTLIHSHVVSWLKSLLVHTIVDQSFPGYWQDNMSVGHTHNYLKYIAANKESWILLYLILRGFLTSPLA